MGGWRIDSPQSVATCPKLEVAKQVQTVSVYIEMNLNVTAPGPKAFIRGALDGGCQETCFKRNITESRGAATIFTLPHARRF